MRYRQPITIAAPSILALPFAGNNDRVIPLLDASMGYAARFNTTTNDLIVRVVARNNGSDLVDMSASWNGVPMKRAINQDNGKIVAVAFVLYGAEIGEHELRVSCAGSAGNAILHFGRDDMDYYTMMAKAIVDLFNV